MRESLPRVDAKTARTALVVQPFRAFGTEQHRLSRVFRDGTRFAASGFQVLMNEMGSTVLAVTDLSAASYKLVGFAAFIAGPKEGSVILVSTYGRADGTRHSEPPNGLSQDVEGWRQKVESRLRQEGQLLERQRQWCADRGVQCRAELYEEGRWPDLVLQSAERSKVDLILVGVQLMASADQVKPEDIDRLVRHAPCPVSMVRLPALLPV